ncbi:MAG: hypothetical protein AAFX08_08975 [Pseudomonadota bacterium]
MKTSSMKTLTLPGVIAVLSLGLVTSGLAQNREIMRQLKADGQVPVSAFVAAAEERASELDADGDGFVTKAEMEAHRDEMRKKLEAKRFPDADEDGVVSEAEFLDAARARFSRLDANEDGVLSKEEMPERGARRRFRGGEPR